MTRLEGAPLLSQPPPEFSTRHAYTTLQHLCCVINRSVVSARAGQLATDCNGRRDRLEQGSTSATCHKQKRPPFHTKEQRALTENGLGGGCSIP
jgi:hypothetical protein